MRTWRITRGELAYTVGGVALMLAIVAYVAGNPEALPAVRIAVGAIAAWNVWELLLGPVHRVTLHDDGRVELRTPLRKGSTQAGDVTALTKRAGDWRGRGPFVMVTPRGRWRVPRKLDPELDSLVGALREHNPDLDVRL